MILKTLFGDRGLKKAASDLYEAIVAQARQPVFYLEADVPDTVDGRYEMVSLHAFLMMRRLKREGNEGQKLSQAVFDKMFVDMDNCLREIGVGDLSVGKRIKAMAQVFYGRIVAYETAIDGEGEETLEEALARNHYGTLETSPKAETLRDLAAYIRKTDAHLAEQTYETLKTGQVSFINYPAA